MISKHKSGYVAIVGEPNAGKSTLLNKIIKEKVSIISPIPQTTIKNIFGILSDRDYQIIFIDTPGIFRKSRHSLDEEMMEALEKTFNDADVIVLLIGRKVISSVTEYLIDRTIKARKPYIIVLNKVDEVEYGEEIYNRLGEKGITPENIIEISAKTGRNLLVLLKKIVEKLPPGPKYYEDDIYTTQTMRNIVSEIIREKIFYLTKHELPHCVAVMTDEFKERPNGTIYIHSIIYVEKESQKKIIIGSGGMMLKKIGSKARAEIEEWLGQKIYLDLHVKVSKNWRKNRMFLKNYLEGVD